MVLLQLRRILPLEIRGSPRSPPSPQHAPHIPSAPVSTPVFHSSKADKETWLDAWRDHSIFFCRSHVGMAVRAFKMDLLDADALARVGTAATEDFKRIWGRYGGRSAGERDVCVRQGVSLWGVGWRG
jgi:hypothetical protein